MNIAVDGEYPDSQYLELSPILAAILEDIKNRNIPYFAPTVTVPDATDPGSAYALAVYDRYARMILHRIDIEAGMLEVQFGVGGRQYGPARIFGRMVVPANQTVFRTNHTENPFWVSGRGARAFEMGQQALGAVTTGFDGESMFRNFFRFAGDLLFEDRPGLEIHSRWVACPKCGHVLVPAKESLRFDGVECKEVVPNTTCDGLLRPIEWSDLTPVAKKAEHADLEIERF